MIHSKTHYKMQYSYFNNTCPLILTLPNDDPNDQYVPDVWFYVWFGVMAALALAFNHRFPPNFDFEQ